MLFFLTFPLLLTLVSKSDADVSETSVWGEHWGISKKIIGTRSLLMYFRKHDTFVNLFDHIFFPFRNDGVIFLSQVEDLKPDRIFSVVSCSR